MRVTKRSLSEGAGLPQLMIEYTFDREREHEAATALLNLVDRPTALFVDNYLPGAGTFRATVDRGRRLTRDQRPGCGSRLVFV